MKTTNISVYIYIYTYDVPLMNDMSRLSPKSFLSVGFSVISSSALQVPPSRTNSSLKRSRSLASKIGSITAEPRISIMVLFK